MLGILMLAMACGACVHTTHGWTFDCGTMDIATNAEAKTSFPQDIDTVCEMINPSTISVVVKSTGKDLLPYSGIMVQIRRRNTPIGTFLTRGTSADRPDAVGPKHMVACGGEALASIDDSPKTETEGRWRYSGPVEHLTDLKCVISLVDTDETNRYIRFPVDVKKSGVSSPSAPPASRFSVPTFPSRQQFFAPTTTPAPTTTIPTTTTTERDWNAGPIKIEGTDFPQSCRDDSRLQWVPLPHTSCREYLTITNRDSLARASHSCNSRCFDTKSCTCRRCEEVVCGRTPITANLTVNIYDFTDEPRGVLTWSRVRQPGLTSGFSINSNRQGNTNPSRLNGRPVYKAPGSSTTAAQPRRKQNTAARGSRPRASPRFSGRSLSGLLSSFGL